MFSLFFLGKSNGIFAQKHAFLSYCACDLMMLCLTGLYKHYFDFPLASSSLVYLAFRALSLLLVFAFFLGLDFLLGKNKTTQEVPPLPTLIMGTEPQL
jgi:hypothetical protein